MEAVGQMRDSDERPPSEQARTRRLGGLGTWMKHHPRLPIPLGVVVLLLVGGTVVALNRDTSPSIIRCVDGVGDCPSSAPPTVPAAIRPPQSMEPTECDPAALDCPESSPTVVPEPPPVEGSPTDLITQPVGSPEVISLLDRYGCTVPEGLYVPGGLIPSSGGFECRDAGVGITLDTDLNISGIGFYGEGVYGFSAYTGPLPFDLQLGPAESTWSRRWMPSWGTR
jgi:hypothetical protein